VGKGGRGQEGMGRKDRVHLAGQKKPFMLPLTANHPTYHISNSTFCDGATLWHRDKG